MLPPDLSPVGRFMLILQAGHAIGLLTGITLAVAAIAVLWLS